METLKDCSRQIRRHHKQRVKNKIKKYWFSTQKKTDRQLGILSSTAKTCSCAGCGNPRKYFKQITIQEKKFNISINDEYEDIDDNI